ncbi:MAG: cysteine peptidase family C39 domain-containing protein, partial [Candidatus Pacebacteria bacterium]|nr:cysteine peptidase family C39 domain-containing protein [Candidatus Paceibacterota bacterium]
KMVLDYYGVSDSEAEIARLAGASKEKGVPAEGLIRAAKHFGFKAFSKKNSTFGDIRGFIRKKMPVIVDWFMEDEGHYSVAVDIDKKSIVLIDPSLKGRRKVPLDKFLRIWFDFPGKFLRKREDLILRLILVVTP